mmetsp:Transcript_9629/g.21962  ORF Transcript_9629/g.21962 Transcript_9629/m.21962 type:complete len:313 (+) Transcript_9629:495-1433(+)
MGDKRIQSFTNHVLLHVLIRSGQRRWSERRRRASDSTGRAKIWRRSRGRHASCARLRPSVGLVPRLRIELDVRLLLLLPRLPWGVGLANARATGPLTAPLGRLALAAIALPAGRALLTLHPHGHAARPAAGVGGHLILACSLLVTLAGHPAAALAGHPAAHHCHGHAVRGGAPAAHVHHGHGPVHVAGHGATPPPAGHHPAPRPSATGPGPAAAGHLAHHGLVEHLPALVAALGQGHEDGLAAQDLPVHIVARGVGLFGAREAHEAEPLAGPIRVSHDPGGGDGAKGLEGHIHGLVVDLIIQVFHVEVHPHE